MVEGKVNAVIVMYRLKTKCMHTCFGEDEPSFGRGRIKDRQISSFRKQDWKVLV